ncbi:efflux RND transporter permease subunit [Leptospira congkakensis]|uniref:Efflux RND transporter permease subunit n=1 Tax=Leptospira congkakensis TaxID=2484932 RepID=A0A4Z1A7K4_9LEPT|nr:CusA/CzcA family heavy metal efflux RND transporter [Leptospira congkakensis]TGL90903.1 efflux RND transporter permease subunit [Leptospira congkakensis]TGL91912.1 efflux RND transporter permease subunit [Leptospira congkakensis]TGL98964.1 efflux RND transporter permease subunit [Leptospira congkakensis]
MLEKIIQFSIHKRATVLVLTAALTIIGFYNALHLSIDAIPDVTNVQVSAVTSVPGLSPLEVEQFITYPIELEFNGMPKVTEIRSISRTGVSSVTVIFEDGTDIYFARQLVNERLKQAENFIPKSYGKPELSPIATGLGDIYEFALVSESHTPEELRTVMEWEVARQLRSVKGIIDVNVVGGDAKQFQIKIDPKRLLSHNLTLSHITEALEGANVNLGGGYIQKGEEQFVIRGESQFQSIDDITRLSVRTSRDGIPLTLGQIAKVETGPALRFGLSTMNGKREVVGGTAMMLLGSNSLQVVSRVKEKMKEIESRLPNGMKIQVYYDRSEFIGRTLSTVFTNLVEAAIIVLVCLILTLGTVKGAFAVALAIPVSMMVATILMNAFGIVGNLMSLGALDFGLLVDGSIVMLESTLHGFLLRKSFLLSKTTAQDMEDGMEEVIMESCIKVVRASAFSVGIILLVYLPLMTLEGVEGRMFRPMAITVAFALGAALLYSITTFPALMSYIYKKPILHESAFWDKFQTKYAEVLTYGMKFKRQFTYAGIGVVLLSFVLASTLGSEFLPRIDEGEIAIDIKRLPSTAINHSRDLNLEMEKVILKFPEAVSVVSRQGRGESAAEPIGSEEGEMMVKLKPRKEWVSASDREELMEVMKNSVNQNVPSSYISLSQPIENRVNALLSGSKADIVIKIYGDDLKSLKAIADNYASKIKKIQGAADLRVQKLLGLPLLEIKMNRGNMARYGVRAEEVLTTIETLRVGANAGKVYEGYKRFDLIVRLDADVTDIGVIENVPVMTELGGTVPLGQVTDIMMTEGPAALYHEGLKRRILVEVNVRGRDMIGFVNDVQAATQSIESDLPQGYYVDWGGQFENFTRAKNRLAIVIPIAGAIIFAMLFIAFGSVYYALGVFILVPLSLSGGILSLVIRGLPFSIPAGVGFIAAAGISVLNGVVYASALKDQLKVTRDPSKAVVEAAVYTLRAVATTELVAIIGFLPMAIASSAGAEVQRPLATVVMGGVLVATILSRFLLPIAFEFLVKLAQRQEIRQMERERKMNEYFVEEMRKYKASEIHDSHGHSHHETTDHPDLQNEDDSKTNKQNQKSKRKRT